MTWAILLKPFIAVLMFFFVVAPTSWLLQKAIPAGRWKNLLFDATLLKRKPWIAWLGVGLFYTFLIGSICAMGF